MNPSELFTALIRLLAKGKLYLEPASETGGLGDGVHYTYTDLDDGVLDDDVGDTLAAVIELLATRHL